jgi:RNA polymerase sigma factor (sigma-70 family)
MLLSDDQLTRRAVSGDRRAFTAIFRRYQEPLYRYCLAILGDREDAEDALQSTMVKVLRALPGERRRIELRPWLYRIAHNEAIELIRRRRPSQPLDAELVAAGAGLAEEASQRERLRELLADLDQLPERQRGALVMRELSGLGFEEIGAALGTSAATARQTLYEARLGLREMNAGREMSCEEAMQAISDADRRVLRRRDIRAHLRNCDSCRSFREEIDGREHDLAALTPLPAVAAAAILQGVLGGGGASGGGIGAVLGAGAAKTAGASTLLKGAAVLAATVAIGGAAADRGGLIHLGLPGEGGAKSRTLEPAGSPPAARSATSEGGHRAAPEGEPTTGKGGDLTGAHAVSRAQLDTESKAAGAATPMPASAEAEPTGSEKKLPEASSHGQETAAAHKAGGHSSGGKASQGAKAKPPHPAKPQHPAKPVHPQTPEHPLGSNSTNSAQSANGEAAAKKTKPEAPESETQAVGAKGKP